MRTTRRARTTSDPAAATLGAPAGGRRGATSDAGEQGGVADTPRSHCPSAARTSGPRRPCADRRSAAGRARRPSRGTGRRAREDAEHAEHAERGRGMVTRVGKRRARSSAGRARGQIARRDAEHEPGDRVLEEAAVEERVHEQARPTPRRARGRMRDPAGARDQERRRRRARSAAYSASPTTPSSAATVTGVVCETNQLRRAAVLRQRLARERLRADPDADDRVLGEDVRRELDAARAVARRSASEASRALSATNAPPPASRSTAAAAATIRTPRCRRRAMRSTRGEERNEARLRVGEEEAREEHPRAGRSERRSRCLPVPGGDEHEAIPSTTCRP